MEELNDIKIDTIRPSKLVNRSEINEIDNFFLTLGLIFNDLKGLMIFYRHCEEKYLVQENEGLTFRNGELGGLKLQVHRLMIGLIREAIKYIHKKKDLIKSIDFKLIESKIHKNNLDKKILDDLIEKLTDLKKKSNYPSSINGYKKFWGKKKIGWFDPPFKHWLVGDLDIKINPELGIEFGGKFYVIKLFLKSEKITKDKLSQILSLMEYQLRKETDEEVIFCVLDVKNSKLYENAKGDFSYLPLLEGEAKSFETIWKAI